MMNIDTTLQEIKDRSALRVLPKTIEAACYNHARLALLRLGAPLRVELDNHRGLDILLDKDCWICLDGGHDDQIIMVWSDFDTSKHNQALYEAVPCQLRLFHMCAGLIMGSALEALDKSLVKELAGI